MGKLMDVIDRIMFGATAEERVRMQSEMVARRVEHLLAAVLTEDEPADDAPEDAQQPEG